MPVDKIVIRKQPKQELYKAYTVVKGRTNPMRPLSGMGLPKKQAEKQAVAVRLSELRAKHEIPPRGNMTPMTPKEKKPKHEIPRGNMTPMTPKEKKPKHEIPPRGNMTSMTPKEKKPKHEIPRGNMTSMTPKEKKPKHEIPLGNMTPMTPKLKPAKKPAAKKPAAKKPAKKWLHAN